VGDKEAKDETPWEGEELYECKSRLRAEQNCLYGTFYALVTAPMFNLVIFLLIIFNTVVLAIDDYPQSKEKTALISIFNVFFCWAFFAEMILKICGLGWKNYAKDKFNMFDAVVVTISLVDWTISSSVADPESLGSGADLLQALRSLRMLRAIKLARTWRDL
jgi:hypothetical protein